MSPDITSPEFIRNRHVYYDRLRQNGNVHYLEANRCWLVIGYQETEQILSDSRTFLSFVKEGQDVILLANDRPGHAENKKKVSSGNSFLNRENQSDLNQYAESIAGGLTALLSGRASAELLHDLIIPYCVCISMNSIGLGNYVSDKNILSGRIQDIPEELDALNEIKRRDKIEEILLDSVNKNGHHFLLGKEISDKYTSENHLKFMKVLFEAGTESPVGLLSNSIHTLLSDRSLLSKLAKNAEDIPLFIDEALRIHAPGQIVYRRAGSNLVLSGKHIAEGDLLAVSISAANRDPAVFENPDTFNPWRSGNKKALSFGKGKHHCVGAHVGRETAAILIRYIMPLVEKWTLRDDAVEYSPYVQTNQILKLHVTTDR